MGLTTKQRILHEERELKTRSIRKRRRWNRRSKLKSGGGKISTKKKKAHTSTNMYKNVYGSNLKACSRDDTALTGFTRNGKCVNKIQDQGSHHVCIDISSTSGGNFCTVTGQPNWCEEPMPCHDKREKTCPIEQWCVCEWAFASYIQNAGGCDKIAKVDCHATNGNVLHHYRDDKRPHVQKALACLKRKCNLP